MAVRSFFASAGKASQNFEKVLAANVAERALGRGMLSERFHMIFSKSLTPNQKRNRIGGMVHDAARRRVVGRNTDNQFVFQFSQIVQ